MFLTFLHGGLANMTLLYFLILSLWGFLLFLRKQGPSSSYWGSLVIGEILVVAQGLLGGYLWLTGARPSRGEVHLIYGFLIPVIIPLVYGLTKGSDKRRDSLAYGAALIFTVGLALRAITTGLDVLP